jgi:hypothetical protein
VKPAWARSAEPWTRAVLVPVLFDLAVAGALSVVLWFVFASADDHSVTLRLLAVVLWLEVLVFAPLRTWQWRTGRRTPWHRGRGKGGHDQREDG